MRHGVPVALLVACAACAQANGTVTGGERRFDAAAQVPPEVVVTACAPEDRGTGHTFSELYKDYFGRVGLTACSGTTGECHGGPSDKGALESNYWCPADDKDTCYQRIRASNVVKAEDRDLPEKSKLYTVLRKFDGDGFMPKSPVCAFDDVDLTRITDWIRAGAPND